MVTMAKSAAVAALAAMLLAPAAWAQEKPKELSDKSVQILMNYAWAILPARFTAPNGHKIEVDKKNKKAETLVPVPVAREVIKVGNLSAQAQLCDMLEDQVINYDAMMRREIAKGTWTEQQLLYITTLHRMTIHMAAGKLKVVDKSADEQQIILEAIEATKDTCNDAKRTEVKAQIAAFAKSIPPLPRKQADPKAKDKAAPQPTPAAAKDEKKK